MKYITFLSFFMLFSFVQCKAQTKETYEHGIFKNQNHTLNYRLLKPKDFDKKNKYPLVLFMHGAGERGNDNEAQLTHGSNLFIKKENREKYNSYVMFPQCDSDDYWADINYVQNDKGLGFKFKENPKPSKSLNSVLKLMDSLVRHPNIDSKRIYVVGLSMGGMATFELLYHRPNMFAAALPICGGGNPNLIDTYIKVPLWVFHGYDDTVVNVKYSIEMVSAIEKKGGSAKFTMYDKIGHDSWNNAFAEPDFLEWLFSKRK